MTGRQHQRGPLQGVRVVEVGQLLAGPFCGHLFADYGAEVIKVEPPGEGDAIRRWGQLYKGLGLYWPILSREKKSVTLDLRHPEGQALLRKLVSTADVFVENFRPGTLERWGVGWEQVSAINPRLVMVRVSGYGQSGPYRDHAGFGAIGEAMSGIRHLTGEPGRAPVRMGISLGDTLAATFGFIGAMLALYNRDRISGSGVGQMVDVGLYEGIWPYMEAILPEYDKLGLIRQPMGGTLSRIAPSNLYPTKDSQWILIGGNTDAVFERLARVMRHPEWSAPDSPYATHVMRGDRQSELDGLIAQCTSHKDLRDLLEALTEAGVPAGRVFTAADISHDPHFSAREMIIEVPEPGLNGEMIRMQGVVPKMSGTPGRISRGGPLLGEHNQEVLGELVDGEQFSRLREEGAI